MSVEGLHTSFERIDKKVRAQIKKGATDSALASCIRHAWSEQFHVPLTASALKGMVGHYRRMFGNKVRKTRKATHQRGGMAPLDWTTGQGVSAAVYGRFPVEMGTYDGAVKSLDRFYENPIARSCDMTGGKNAPAHQAGGGLFDVIGMGHPIASVPRNGFEGVVSTVQGHPTLNPPSDPTISRLQMDTYTPSAFPIPTTTISSLAPIYSP
jgi:hypothetical protein